MSSINPPTLRLSRPNDRDSVSSMGPASDHVEIGTIDPTHDERPSENINLAISLMAESKEKISLANLNSVVFLFREALESCPVDHPLYFDTTKHLASSLGLRFLVTNHKPDFHASFLLRIKLAKALIMDGNRTFRSKVTFDLRDHTEEIVKTALEILSNLQKSISFQVATTIISLLRSSLLRLPNADPQRVIAFTTLADALYARYQHSSGTADLADAISSLQSAAACFPQGEAKQLTLLRRCIVLAERFDSSGKETDLQLALRSLVEVQNEDSDREPGTSSSDLTARAAGFYSRFLEFGDKAQLDTAISLFRKALTNSPVGSDQYITAGVALGAAMTHRFDLTRQQKDLDEAISSCRRVLALGTPPYPHNLQCITSLALNLVNLFNEKGRECDLDEAIALHRQALKWGRPPPETHRSMSLNNLGLALKKRYEHRGQRSDQEEAIAVHREALELLPHYHPKKPLLINNLANVLSNDNGNDIDKVISLHRQALDLRPWPHPDRAMSLYSIANSLRIRFETQGKESDLDQSISMNMDVLALFPPPHPNRPSSLNNLATALLARFKYRGHHEDLDEAIRLNREGVELQPPLYSVAYLSLNNLARALKMRFDAQGEQSDLDEIIYLRRKVVDFLPLTHPHRPESLFSLGTSLMKAYDMRTGDTSQILDEGLSSLLAAAQCPSAQPSLRLIIAKVSTTMADVNNHPSAVDAYDVALQTLPQVAALSSDIQSRQEALNSHSDGLARDASRCAIRFGNLNKAVEFLEAGRTVFWSQALNLRSSLDRLNDVAPELATRLRNIAAALESGSHQAKSIGKLDEIQRLLQNQNDARLNRLHKEWEEGIEEVRYLEGFKNFLRPRSLASLQAAASKYPIIYLIAAGSGSDCLIITSTEVLHIPLQRLPASCLQYLVNLVQMAVSDLPISRSVIDEAHEKITNMLGEQRGMRLVRPHELSSDGIFKAVLGVIWKEVVRPIIDLLNLRKSREMRVLQWCPTGLFTFLPIHAAGLYDDKQGVECASDYFISSYTPSIGALLTDQQAPSVKPFKMMVVIQSQDLPSTKKELGIIKSKIPGDTLISLGTHGAPAMVESVASELSNVSGVHFACHGKQDQLKPLNSGLKLNDGVLTVSRIMKETMPNGSLAFLCACETAMGDKTLPDEAISLGASLVFTGFRHVIATMWEMRDEDGPTVVEAFYEELFKFPDSTSGLVPNTSMSAYALHTAIQALRSQKVAFCRWVPFIHIGK